MVSIDSTKRLQTAATGDTQPVATAAGSGRAARGFSTVDAVASEPGTTAPPAEKPFLPTRSATKLRAIHSKLVKLGVPADEERMLLRTPDACVALENRHEYGSVTSRDVDFARSYVRATTAAEYTARARFEMRHSRAQIAICEAAESSDFALSRVFDTCCSVLSAHDRANGTDECTRALSAMSADIIANPLALTARQLADHLFSFAHYAAESPAVGEHTPTLLALIDVGIARGEPVTSLFGSKALTVMLSATADQLDALANTTIAALVAPPSDTGAIHDELFRIDLADQVAAFLATSGRPELAARVRPHALDPRERITADALEILHTTPRFLANDFNNVEYIAIPEGGVQALVDFVSNAHGDLDRRGNVVSQLMQTPLARKVLLEVHGIDLGEAPHSGAYLGVSDFGRNVERAIRLLKRADDAWGTAYALHAGCDALEKIEVGSRSAALVWEACVQVSGAPGVTQAARLRLLELTKRFAGTPNWPHTPHCEAWYVRGALQSLADSTLAADSGPAVVAALRSTFDTMIWQPGEPVKHANEDPVFAVLIQRSVAAIVLHKAFESAGLTAEAESTRAVSDARRAEHRAYLTAQRRN